jgi:hypothetical protein
MHTHVSGVDTELVEYLILTVPDLEALSTVTPAIAQLVASAQIRILDVVCLAAPEGGGAAVPRELDSLESVAALRHVEGEFGGLFSDGDLKLAALALAPGEAGLLLLIEDLWAAPLAAAVHQCGGRILGGEHTPPSRAGAALAQVAPAEIAPAPPAGPDADP